jgi:mannitol-specific phosphotransferase system IIBC component
VTCTDYSSPELSNVLNNFKLDALGNILLILSHAQLIATLSLVVSKAANMVEILT